MASIPTLKRSDVLDTPVEVLEEVLDELKDESESLEILAELLSELKQDESIETVSN